MQKVNGKKKIDTRSRSHGASSPRSVADLKVQVSSESADPVIHGSLTPHASLNLIYVVYSHAKELGTHML